MGIWDLCKTLQKYMKEWTYSFLIVSKFSPFISDNLGKFRQLQLYRLCKGRYIFTRVFSSESGSPVVIVEHVCREWFLDFLLGIATIQFLVVLALLFLLLVLVFTLACLWWLFSTHWGCLPIVVVVMSWGMLIVLLIVDIFLLCLFFFL